MTRSPDSSLTRSPDSSVASAVEVPSSQRRRGRLLQILGFGFGVAIIVGNTIGVGMLRTPGDVATQLPNRELFLAVWIVGGFFTLLAAMNVAELGTMLPYSGGHYTFARHALGEYPGFVIGWTDWLSTCGSESAAAVVMGEYLGILFAPLAGRSRLLAAAIVIFLAALQWRGVRWGSGFQQFSTLLKGLAFFAFVFACFFFRLASSQFAPAAPTQLPHGWPLFVAFLLAMQSMIYTYDGWAGVIYFSEEVQNPARNIPRSMFGGALAVAAIYISVGWALVHVLPITAYAGKQMALGTAADSIWSGHGTRLIAALTVISVISFMNACHMMASRILFAMSRDKLVTSHADVVNRGGTPTIALALSTAAALMFIVYGGFNKIIAVLAFFFVINYIADFMSIFVLRRREPNRERPYRIPGYPWTTVLALLIYLGFLASICAADTRNSIYALILLAGSYPAFKVVKSLSASSSQ